MLPLARDRRFYPKPLDEDIQRPLQVGGLEPRMGQDFLSEPHHQFEPVIPQGLPRECQCLGRLWGSGNRGTDSSAPRPSGVDPKASFINVALTGPRLNQAVDSFAPLLRMLKHLSFLNVPLYPSILDPKNLTDLTLRYHRSDVHMDALLFLGAESLPQGECSISGLKGHPFAMIRDAALWLTLSQIQRVQTIRNDLVNARVFISNAALPQAARLEVMTHRLEKPNFEMLGKVCTSYATPTSHLFKM
jgi:hypothetical protein